MKRVYKDLTIIGGGPGGYVAGPIAASAGLSVACIEKEVLGGICLKWGCMPTKALTAISHRIDILRNSGKYGINVEKYSIDFASIMKRNKKHVEDLEKGCVTKFAKAGIDLFMGIGRLVDDNTVMVTPDKGQPFLIESKNILLDTGSVPFEIPPFSFMEPGIMTNREILSLESLPESILIIGGGVMGCEFANIFSNLGVKIHVVEMMPRLLGTIDEDVANVIEDDFRSRSIDLHLGTCVEYYSKENGEFVCRLSDASEIRAEKVLIVVGRKPNSRELSLENSNVKTGAKGEILVDEYLRTSSPSIYAIGDVIGGTLAHVSRLEGEVVVRNILGENRKMNYRVVPWAIFTSIEISGVGITEQEARKRDLDIRISISPFKSNGKAKVSDEAEGFVKTIIDSKNGNILGTQIVGSHSSDLIHEMALAMHLNGTAEQVSRMIHVHPTLAEAILKTTQQLV